MGLKKATTSLEQIIEKAGGCAVVDGGFATQLERHGATINDPLWSALCLIKDTHLIKQVSFTLSLCLVYVHVCLPLLFLCLVLIFFFMDFKVFVLFDCVIGSLGILGSRC